jgi:threonine dehydratase
MSLITFADIQAAAERLRGIAHYTPVFTSRTLDAAVGCSVFLKGDHLQRGGAFKFRGAYNALCQLDAAQRQCGVVAFSSGNHAQGVALAAQLLGIPAVICMPDDAPTVKVAATRGYGAEVIFYNRQTEDRAAVAARLANERGLALIPPYDHPAIIAGQGTATLELLEQVGMLDAVVAPISGGGLISGTALAAHGIDPTISVVGVEPADADDTRRSLLSGRRETIPPPQTIADGLRVTIPGELTFPIMQQHLREVVTVSDDEIREALRFALLRLKLVLEPSGAAGLAAVLSNKLPMPGKRVGVILCGGNIEPALLQELFVGAQ